MLASQLPTRAQPQGCTRHFAPCTLRYKNILYCCINNTDTKLRRSAIVTNVSPGKTESSLQNSIDTHANRSHVYGIDSTTACLPAGVRVVHVSQHPDGNLPFLLYLPDIDGDGVTSRSQWQAWAEHFDMNVLTLDANCACSFSELATAVGVWLGHELAGTAPHRPVYLLGEGFGGVLGLQLAWDCRRLVNRIVLVNPATSYLDSQLARMTTSLERVPPALLNLQLPVPPPLPFSLPPPLPVALAPLLGTSPQALLRQLVDSLGQQQPAEAVQALRRALDQVEQISSRLTPATFLHRLKMLEEGIRLVGPRLSRVPQRTMIIAGGQDLVLGSDKEAQRLVETMQRAFKVVLPDAGHALLYEPGGELLPLLDKEGFYIRRRVFSSPVRPGVDVNTFGTAGPVELPNFQEVGRYAASWTARLRELSSPVFMSTLADGTRVMGLEGLPYRKRPVGYGARSSHGKPLAEVSVGSAEGGEGHRAAGPYEAPGGEDPGEEAELGTGGAPLLFVGNHQLYAFDMAVSEGRPGEAREEWIC
ncbi:hypothetical protein Vafri_12969 [Volvox africanus]|nr:hypothetical protein Vafri_12969 [Volvox africanus]